MSTDQPIENKVAKSPLVTLDLADHYPQGERIVYDLKDNLFQEMILREKDFRAFVKEHDWAQYEGKHVALTCSVDAIVPNWAYMLLTSKLAPYAQTIVFGDEVALEQRLFEQALSQLDVTALEGKKVVVKGCGDLPISPAAYVEITRLLAPAVSSLMYGEPCSTVPVYKQPRKKATT